MRKNEAEKSDLSQGQSGDNPETKDGKIFSG
jgi:hypothetical protein